jgi:hypothetical protein
MIAQLPLHELLQKAEVVPQAIIAETIDVLAERLGFKVEKGDDDFDEYEGCGSFLAQANCSFALMHYKGHPPGTTTLYLPFEIEDVDQITAIVAQIATELDVHSKLLWQRKDGPDSWRKRKSSVHN